MKNKLKYPYRDNNSKKYLKDRAELFAKSGNGWWRWQGTSLAKEITGELSAKKRSKTEKKS